ncbi:MAG: glucose 1-dehydrogenase [Deinococcota bacterium]
MSKVMLVTGSSRGIGAATVLLAAENGFDVIVNYVHNVDAAQHVVTSIQERGQHAIAIQADIACQADVDMMFAAIDDHFGKLDALVNNAGTLEQQMPLEDMTVDRWQRVFAVNVFGTFLCCQKAIKRMKAGSGIVNVSSIAATLGSPFEYVDYAASKAAVDTLTIGLAKEVASRGIRVNTVRPGTIHTEIHALGGEPERAERVKASIPMQRVGEAQEIAEAILWLLSDKASYMTGACVDVSGGR